MTPGTAEIPAWTLVRRVPMQGDWRIFWNVGGGDVGFNNRETLAHGFRLVNLLNTYADYPGNQQENIDRALKGNRTNLWKKPDFFERIIRRNIVQAGQTGEIMVHDIDFEEDVNKAWDDVEARKASGVANKDEFAKAYFRQWASWFSLPCQWARLDHPGMQVGLYGPQPFCRDYWGVAGKSAQQIDGTHRSDAELWQYIDPQSTFYHETTTRHMRYFVRAGLKKARAASRDLTIFTTPYPPADMTRRKVPRGRDLDPAHQRDLARCLVDWVKNISLQNEGEEWLRWTQSGLTDRPSHDYNIFWPPARPPIHSVFSW